MVKRRVPNVVRGGAAIPLKNKTNYYYMTGRKHSNGGIDIGENPRTGLEVEDGEVMHIGKNEVKVFSSVPFLNGESPAEKVMKGDNPDKVFNAQESFKRNNKINDDGTEKKRMGGKRKNNNDSLKEELSITDSQYKMGGLSRSKDYGSESKPYPSVKSKDFAGSGRSYPIPTKADAVDALRLAGLHGRSDVKAKVYRKYPELRKKSKAGGVYSLTIDGKTRLRYVPSTGDETQRKHSEFGSDNIKEGPEPVKEPKINLGVPMPKFDKITSLNVPRYIKFSKNKIDFNDIDNDLLGDGIGIASNTIGGLLSHKWNRDMLNKLKYSDQPIARNATRLKTRININPQLDKMRETLAAYERDIDNNTASSRVALARKQRARLANMLATNELYGNKENMETELINKDKLNQQSVAHANIADYNRWDEDRAAFRNAILEKKAENDVALAETLNAGVQDLIGRREKRKSENQTITSMALANPNLPIEMLYAQGLVNKKTYEAYKKAYRNKKER